MLEDTQYDIPQELPSNDTGTAGRLETVLIEQPTHSTQNRRRNRSAEAEDLVISDLTEFLSFGATIYLAITVAALTDMDESECDICYYFLFFGAIPTFFRTFALAWRLFSTEGKALKVVAASGCIHDIWFIMMGGIALHFYHHPDPDIEGPDNKKIIMIPFFLSIGMFCVAMVFRVQLKMGMLPHIPSRRDCMRLFQSNNTAHIPANMPINYQQMQMEESTEFQKWLKRMNLTQAEYALKKMGVNIKGDLKSLTYEDVEEMDISRSSKKKLHEICGHEIDKEPQRGTGSKSHIEYQPADLPRHEIDT